MTTFIDSHAHLGDAAFDADRSDVLARARRGGVVAVVCIGESLEAAARSQTIAMDHPGVCYYTAGVHPHDAATFDPLRDLDAIRAHCASGAVAVGECGLDYHYDHSPREKQRTTFAAQLTLAGELDRPVVVHTREAEADTQSMVREAGQAGVRGVLHCYTGSHELAAVALDAGWYVSFSGIVTFRQWDDVELLRLVPDDQILVESDSPYLAPVPHRGMRNEPEWVSFTAARLASARESDIASIGALTTVNAQRLFGLA